MSGLSWFTAFVIANVLQFGFGIAITGLSYSAYRSSGRKNVFRYSTIGFLLITIGGVLAPLYELGIKGDYNITGQELLELQIIEGTVIAVGLAFLLYSIFSRARTSKTVFADPDLDDHYFEDRENP